MSVSSLHKVCVICCDETKNLLFKFCRCTRCFLCKSCIDTLNRNATKKCPVCRQNLVLYKKYKLLNSITAFINSYKISILYIFQVILILTLYVGIRYYNDKDLLEELQNNKNTDIFNQIINHKIAFIVINSISELLFIPITLTIWHLLQIPSNDIGNLDFLKNIINQVEFLTIFLLKLLFLLITASDNPKQTHLLTYLVIFGLLPICLIVLILIARLFIIIILNVNQFIRNDIKFSFVYKIYGKHINYSINSNNSNSSINEISSLNTDQLTRTYNDNMNIDNVDNNNNNIGDINNIDIFDDNIFNSFNGNEDVFEDNQDEEFGFPELNDLDETPYVFSLSSSTSSNDNSTDNNTLRTRRNRRPSRPSRPNRPNRPRSNTSINNEPFDETIV